MNPFALRGPPFLVLFLFASVLGCVVMYLAVRGRLFGSGRPAASDAYRHLRDPYLMAYLRGGFSEACQTVVFSLHERKLLTDGDSRLAATGSKDSLQAIRNPLELALLRELATPRSLVQLLNDGKLKDAVESYAAPLREAGLVADAEELQRRLPIFLVVGGGLAGLSGSKLYVALNGGHSNVAFLVIITLLALFVVFAIFRRRRTNAGDTALANQQSLLSRLRDRVSRLAADGATNEAVLVAATFGLIALPSRGYPFAAQLRKQASKQSDSGSGSSNGCGGGGCGGGCGGCGG
jgi:uncharacterized protein (TIGR04222 family)